MGKKIVIATILVLTLLLLMPSIQAIQQKTIEDEALYDFDVLDKVKHPILYNLIKIIMSYRWEFGIELRDISIETDYWGGVRILYPLLFLWWFWIHFTIQFNCVFWNNISDKLGWNWELPFPL